MDTEVAAIREKEELKRLEQVEHMLLLSPELDYKQFCKSQEESLLGASHDILMISCTQ